MGIKSLQTPHCFPMFQANSPPRAKLSMLLAKIAPLAFEASNVPLYKGLIQWSGVRIKNLGLD